MTLTKAVELYLSKNNDNRRRIYDLNNVILSADLRTYPYMYLIQ